MAGATMTAGWRRLDALPASLIAALALTVVAGLLGGASRGARGFLIAVELTALPVGAVALRRLSHSGLPWRTLGVVALVVAIPVLQCLPLPAELWLEAPGQDARFAALAASGADLGWRPLSLDPVSTLAAIPALVPPIAMLLVTLGLGADERRWVAAGWIALALTGLMLGLAQMAQVDGGWAYPYAATNTGSLVGWFRQSQPRGGDAAGLDRARRDPRRRPRLGSMDRRRLPLAGGGGDRGGELPRGYRLRRPGGRADRRRPAAASRLGAAALGGRGLLGLDRGLRADRGAGSP